MLRCFGGDASQDNQTAAGRGENGKTGEDFARAGRGQRSLTKQFSNGLSLGKNDQGACPFERVEEKYAVHQCPFRHGSVSPHPFPGYVHGRNPQFCTHGCAPDPNLGKDESPRETLIREAMEYQNLYHFEHKSSDEVRDERKREILEEIEKTGTYKHTYDELEFGTRAAWRFAPKCSNRKFWNELRLLDWREKVTTNDEMFEAILYHLDLASNSGSSEAIISVFRPPHPDDLLPGGKGGPRVWNSQLVRYSAYRTEDGTIMGDPSELEFTEMLATRYGYEKPHEERTNFDVLPLLLQLDPSKPPDIYHIPKPYILEVPLVHPVISSFADLGLKWYAIPAVANMEVTIGGILYTAIPFNGWYADTEIVRNMSDESRYNMLPAIAKSMGLDTSQETTMWRDESMAVLDRAVMYSYMTNGISMVDHNTLMRQFYAWYHTEKSQRGYNPPGNWKWIIPPVNASTSVCYLNLNKMTEFTLKPAYLYAPGWKSYMKRLETKLQRTKSHREIHNPFLNPYLMIFLGRLKSSSKKSRCKILILFATVSGTTQRLANYYTDVLKGFFNVTLKPMDSAEDCLVPSAGDSSGEPEYNVVVLMTSTYGSGTPPISAKEFLKYVSGNEGKKAVEGQLYCVFGVGSQSYPRFCGAADLLHSTMLSQRAVPLLERVGKGDSTAGLQVTFKRWMKTFGSALLNREIAPKACTRFLDMLEKDDMAQFQYRPKVKFNLLKGTADRDTVSKLQMQRPGTANHHLFGSMAGDVLEARELIEKATEERSTKLIRIKLPYPHLMYYPGDHIAIFATNHVTDAELIKFLSHFNLGADVLDRVFDLSPLSDFDMNSFPYQTPSTLRKVLLEHLAMKDKPDMISCGKLASFCENKTEQERLLSMAKNTEAYEKYVSSHYFSWWTVFDRFPSLHRKIPIELVITDLPLIAPRYYSISSSTVAHPQEVHGTISRLVYRLQSNYMVKGFCSNYSCNARAGDVVNFKLLPATAFRLPRNPEHPIILVGAGTGIAPMKGFWEERQGRIQEGKEKNIDVKLGKAILFFGCRSKSEFLYEEEIMHALGVGALSDVFVAYSREPDVAKTYVQGKIKQQENLVRETLQDPNSHVYICGDTQMASSVSATVSKIIGQPALGAMVNSGRWHEDVFGIVSNAKSRIEGAKAIGRSVELHHKMRTLLEAKKMSELNELMRAVETESPPSGTRIIDTPCEYGNSLLHVFATKGNTDLVKTLIVDYNANINGINAWGLTPAKMASIRGHNDTAEVIEEFGGRLTARVHQSFYPLHTAVLEGDLDKIKQLMEKKANVNQLDMSGQTPLHLAVFTNAEDCCKALIDMGASMTIMDRQGNNVMQLALLYGKPSIVTMIDEAGGSLNEQSTMPTTTEWSRAEEQSSSAKQFEMSPEDLAAVKAAWSFLENGMFPDKIKETLTEHGVELFHNLFEISPMLLELFPFKDENGKPIQSQLEKHALQVMEQLGEIIEGLDNLDSLISRIQNLTDRHVKYGVEVQHYEILKNCLLSTLQTIFGESWSDRDEQAWQKVFSVITHCAKKTYKVG